MPDGQHRLVMFTLEQEKAMIANFWSKADKSGECWLWKGTTSGSMKYGRFVHRFVSTWAHRFSFILRNGPIPDGFVVMHTCDVPACVNPDHLRIGTQRENMNDMISKGRHKPNYLGNPGAMPEYRRRMMVAITSTPERRRFSSDNMKRAWSDGRIKRERSSECPKGHKKEFKFGAWTCVECNRAASREYQRRRRLEHAK